MRFFNCVLCSGIHTLFFTYCSITVGIFLDDKTNHKKKDDMQWQKQYHRWLLHPSDPHSPLCRCRSYRAWGTRRCHWHKGTWVAYTQPTRRTLHRSGPRSRCPRRTPSSLWYTCLRGLRHTDRQTFSVLRHSKPRNWQFLGFSVAQMM